MWRRPRSKAELRAPFGRHTDNIGLDATSWLGQAITRLKGKPLSYTSKRRVKRLTMTRNSSRAVRDRAALRAQIARDRAALRRDAAPRNPKPAPRPKAAPQRGNAQKRAGPRRQSRLSYDSFNPAPMPMAFSVGRCTRLQGLARCDFSTEARGTGHDYVLAIFNGAPGRIVGSVYEIRTGTTPAPIVNNIKNMLMDSAGFNGSTAASATHPDNAMCSKFSVRLRNTSKAIDVGSVVRVLNMSAGANADKDNPADMVALLRYVEGHPRTKTFGGDELRVTQQWDTHPVDQSQYHKFVSPGRDVDDAIDAMRDPAMSSIVMVFPVFPNNTYEVTANGHYYARYRVTGALANMAMNPPIADLSLLNRARDEAESIGSAGYRAAVRLERHAEPYIGASIGRAVGGMIEGAV